MRNFSMLVVIVAMLGCTKPDSSSVAFVNDDILIKNNLKGSDSYKIIIINNEFEKWFANHSKPADFYSQKFYRYQNHNYVSSWNEIYRKSMGLKPFDRSISYDMHGNYALDFNYRLFWYFKFVEAKYGASYNFPMKASVN